MFLILSLVGSVAAGFDHDYVFNGTTYEAYVAYPDAVEHAPVVILVHQWLGIGSGEKFYADELAKRGYFAFAVDMYGKGVRWTTPTAETTAIVTFLRGNPLIMRARANQALEVLAKDFSERVDLDLVVAQGYCFGGGVAMEMARSGAAVKGVVTYHGAPYGPYSTTIRNKIDSRTWVQLHHAGKDDQAELRKAEAEMASNTVGVWQSHNYGNAPHGFTLPDSTAYDVVSARISVESGYNFIALLIDNLTAVVPISRGLPDPNFP